MGPGQQLQQQQQSSQHATSRLTQPAQPREAQQQSQQQSAQQATEDGGSYLRLSGLNASNLLNLSASDEGRPLKDVVAILAHQRLVITDRERGRITGQQDQEQEQQLEEQPSEPSKRSKRSEPQRQPELTNQTAQNATISRRHGEH